MKKKILPALLAGLFSTTALAFDAFVVKDIRVEGIQRTEAGTVFGYLPIKVGETMTDDKAAEAIRALFATGFYKDVRVEADGNVLVVVVEERPAVSNVELDGIKAFDKDALKKGLKEVGLADGRIFDRAMLEKAEQELKRQYLSKGYYATTITTTVTPLERNRVGVNFAVEEGDVAKIRQINIVGARAFAEKDLLGLFAMTTPGWMTWYTKNDQYSKQKLSGDLETLRSFYLDRGYIEFAIDSTQISISPDKTGIYITININEGEQYGVSSVKLAGDLLLPEAELRQLVTLKPGEVFSRETLTETTKKIAERLGNEGYAFANVNAVPELDKAKRQVAFTIFVDPGRRVYVRRINLAGNTRSRDEIIRREARQMEGAWYDGEKINRTKVRVDRLGFFEEVNVETPAVPGTTDQVDMNISVKEKSTGSIMAGAGFSSSEKLVLSGSISQGNLFGSGKALSLSINTSKVNQVYAVSYTDPYYTVDGISRGFDIYKRKTDPSSISTSSYSTSSYGGGVRYGFPIAEDNSVIVGLSVDSTTVNTDANSTKRYLDFVKEFGNTNTTLLLSSSWASDKRDSAIYTTKGSVQRLFGEVALPGGSLHYYKLNYQYQTFNTFARKYVLMLNGEAGIGNGYRGQPLAFYKNFYAGGIGSVRGYSPSSLGPPELDATNNPTGNYLGGNRRLVGNAEILLPLPGLGADKSLRLGPFIDAGWVWGEGQKMTFSDLRYSTGVSVAWTSPVGPLKFSIAAPFHNQPTDKVQHFQFQLGTSF